jgi:hypothetical protein
MKNWEVLETRFISGRGIIRLPQDTNALRALTIFADLVRPPKNEYLSTDWNPSKSLYARMVFLKDGKVVKQHKMEFRNERIDAIPDIAGQVLRTVQCAYKGVLQSFVNLGEALNLSVVSVTDAIADFKSLEFLFDEIKVVCYSSAVVRLTILGLEYDVCDEEQEDNFVPPPPPPPTSPLLPPDTPFTDISNPYPGEDEDDTLPDDLDELEPLTGVWTIKWFYTNTPGFSGCPYLGTTDTIIREGLSSDTFGLVDQGTGNGRIWRLTINDVPDPVALVEYRCFPNFQPEPVFDLVQ